MTRSKNEPALDGSNVPDPQWCDPGRWCPVLVLESYSADPEEGAASGERRVRAQRYVSAVGDTT